MLKAVAMAGVEPWGVGGCIYISNFGFIYINFLSFCRKSPLRIRTF